MEAGLERRQVAERFTEAGGTFVAALDDIVERVAACRAVVFDWDGVFNTGVKAAGAASGFSETDSMGTNMLRYGLWRRHGELPRVSIISGENNPVAVEFARREHFDAVYTGVSDKRRVIDALCAGYDLEPRQIACVFDDVNDLSMAAVCGLRLLVRRSAAPMFADYVARNGLSDYQTGPGARPVRESCELLLGLLGNYDEVIASRVAFDERYQAYWRARQALATRISDGSATAPGHRLAQGGA